jgi:hypothetical protein
MAQGTIPKAIAEAEKGIAHNRHDGEIWSIMVEVYFYL